MKARNRRKGPCSLSLILAGVFVLLLLAPSFSVDSSIIADLVNSPSKVNISQSPALKRHDSIQIHSNTEFLDMAADELWEGTGRPGDPFIIEYLWIEEPDFNPILIENTDVHFIIRHCLIDGVRNIHDGVIIRFVRNGVIANSTITNCLSGIGLESSQHNEISGNEIYDNEGAITLWDSRYNEILDNVAYTNGGGIVINDYSEFNDVMGNQIFDSGAEGVALWGSNNNTISLNYISGSNSGIILYQDNPNNTISWNHVYGNLHTGILLELDGNINNIIANNTIYENRNGIRINSGSNDNLIADNLIQDHPRFGLILWESGGNIVEWNDFVNNFPEISSQAYDGPGLIGNPNVFEYNYWSDWTTPDDEEPFRIVDVPYSITGEAKNEDPYPRTGPKLDLKLSGEFDFLLQEDIHLQLAALLTDKNTGEPISEANVTFVVYDPDRVELWRGVLLEQVSGTGVYLNKSLFTMAELELPKGIYIVVAYAEAPYSKRAMDMIQFHIDPPGGSDTHLISIAGTGSLMLVASVVGVSWSKKRE